jgi:hypothetical protein
MSPVKVACPRCQAALSATPPFPPGLRVRCSSCGTIFPLVAQGGIAARTPRLNISAAASKGAAVPVAVGVSPPPRSVVSASPAVAWLPAVLVVGLVLLAVGGLTVFFVARGKNRNDDNAISLQTGGGYAVITAAESRPAPLPLSTPKEEGADSGRRPLDTPADNRARSGRLAEPSPPPTTLAPNQQGAVNQAIDRGVAFLKRTQNGNGSWGSSGHPVGYAALSGLTLLECSVPASDPVVRKATAFVRKKSGQLTATYEVALAILFLERLGEAGDRLLVQQLALRLVAGQLADGGWTYRCEVLDSAQEATLLQHLERLRPDSTPDLFKPVVKAPAQETEPLKSDDARAKRKRRQATGTLQPVPALQEPLEVRQEPISPTADNSNTQFAILALWASQRLGVPVERSLALVVQRFRPCQNDDGGWGYHSGGGQRSASTPSMTCVGLLGLAVGHGLGGDDSAARGSVSDPQIEKALRHLGKRIGAPSGKRRPAAEDLYFLWSLERVGVLYGLRTIDGKDWYAWGAELLQARQTNDGSWNNGRYHGSTPTLDTCFALLILKRANLTHDLTKKIEFLKIVPNPQEPGIKNQESGIRGQGSEDRSQR